MSQQPTQQQVQNYQPVPTAHLTGDQATWNTNLAGVFFFSGFIGDSITTIGGVHAFFNGIAPAPNYGMHIVYGGIGFLMQGAISVGVRHIGHLNRTAYLQNVQQLRQNTTLHSHFADKIRSVGKQTFKKMKTKNFLILSGLLLASLLSNMSFIQNLLNQSNTPWGVNTWTLQIFIATVGSAALITYLAQFGDFAFFHHKDNARIIREQEESIYGNEDDDEDI